MDTVVSFYFLFFLLYHAPLNLSIRHIHNTPVKSKKEKEKKNDNTNTTRRSQEPPKVHKIKPLWDEEYTPT